VISATLLICMFLLQDHGAGNLPCNQPASISAAYRTIIKNYLSHDDKSMANINLLYNHTDNSLVKEMCENAMAVWKKYNTENINYDPISLINWTQRFAPVIIKECENTEKRGLHSPIIEIEIGSEGYVGKAFIKNTSNNICIDAALLRYIKCSLWIPAIKNNKYVDKSLIVQLQIN
jgi:hypothetical protein